MKKILYLIIISILLLSVVACQSSEEVSVKAEMNAPGGAPKGGPGMGMPFGGSKPEGGMPPMGQSSSKQTTANAKEATELKDTDGNTIYSGGVRLSFDNRKVVINASYIIDNCTVEITEGEYNTASGSSDEVVFLVINGGKLVIKGSDGNPVVITKSGSASENGHIDDDYNFYGINSAIVVHGKNSSAEIEYANITTSADGSNAIVATENGEVEIENSTILTTGSAGSRGLHSTYEGEIEAENVKITTYGNSSASLATDRGGGSVSAKNMTLETNGQGSPLVYSTGEIEVYSSTGSANGSQMVVVEGGSSAYVENCEFTSTGKGNRTGTSEVNKNEHEIDACGIFIYQSFSGDSSIGTSSFEAVDSTFTVTGSGMPMFYITNIKADIKLSGNCEFNQASNDDYFLVTEATLSNGWGSSGSNGGKTTLTTSGFGSTKSVFVGSSSRGSSLTVNKQSYKSSSAKTQSITL